MANLLVTVLRGFMSVRTKRVIKKWIEWNEGAAIMFVVSGVILAVLFAFGE